MQPEPTTLQVTWAPDAAHLNGSSPAPGYRPVRDWTVRDIEDFERAAGIDFGDLGAALTNPGTSKGGSMRLIAALVWIAYRRHRPEWATFDDVYDGVPGADLAPLIAELLAGVDAQEDEPEGPTVPAPAPAAAR
jgi:hypothetical protein